MKYLSSTKHINRDILECKWKMEGKGESIEFDINRDILECKYPNRTANQRNGN